MKSILSAACLMLALSGVAQAAASPAPSHMMGHSMKSGSMSKKNHMMAGHMKGGAMKGGSMKSDHMMGHAMASPSAMHGAMGEPSHSP